MPSADVQLSRRVQGVRRCIDCGTAEARFWLRAKDAKGEPIENKYRCNRCYLCRERGGGFIPQADMLKVCCDCQTTTSNHWCRVRGKDGKFIDGQLRCNSCHNRSRPYRARKAIFTLTEKD